MIHTSIIYYMFHWALSRALVTPRPHARSRQRAAGGQPESPRDRRCRAGHGPLPWRTMFGCMLMSAGGISAERCGTDTAGKEKNHALHDATIGVRSHQAQGIIQIGR